MCDKICINLAEENLDLKSQNQRLIKMLEKVVSEYSYMFGMCHEIKEINDLLSEVKNESESK